MPNGIHVAGCLDLLQVLIDNMLVIKLDEAGESLFARAETLQYGPMLMSG